MNNLKLCILHLCFSCLFIISCSNYNLPRNYKLFNRSVTFPKETNWGYSGLTNNYQISYDSSIINEYTFENEEMGNCEEEENSLLEFRRDKASQVKIVNLVPERVSNKIFITSFHVSKEKQNDLSNPDSSAKLSNISLGLGIFSLPLVVIGSSSGLLILVFLGLLAMLGAIVFGSIALYKQRRSENNKKIRTKAIAGILLGGGFILLLFAILLYLNSVGWG